MKLYGKELDKELAFRRQSQDERREQRLGIRDAAKQRGINPTELLAYEYGYDVCPHEEYKDEVGGFPIPKILMKVCKKCGKVDENSTEKVEKDNEEHWTRIYNVYKGIYDKPKDENKVSSPEEAHTCPHGFVGDGSCDKCSVLYLKEDKDLGKK